MVSDSNIINHRLLGSRCIQQCESLNKKLNHLHSNLKCAMIIERNRTHLDLFNMAKKSSSDSEGHIFYAGPMFHQYLVPVSGVTHVDRPWEILPADDMEFYSHCAMYFARCAHLAILEIPEQVTLEGEDDLTVHLRPLLDSCMMVYGIDDIEKLMKLMPLVRRIAFMRNIAWSDRFQAWLDSGGRAYNEVTREPEALNKGD